MQTVHCLDCRRFSFERAGREWAGKGVGCCEDHITALKFDPERDRWCGRHERAEQAIVAKRVEWMAKVRRRQAEAERYHLIAGQAMIGLSAAIERSI